MDWDKISEILCRALAILWLALVTWLAITTTP